MDEDQVWLLGPPVSEAPEVDGGLLVFQVHSAGCEAAWPEMEWQEYVDESDEKWRPVEGGEVREQVLEGVNGGGEVEGEEVEEFGGGHWSGYEGAWEWCFSVQSDLILGI